MDTIPRTPGPHCPLCLRHRSPADAGGLEWSSHHGPDGVVFVCGPCTRTHLVDLETGLLDPARQAGSAGTDGSAGSAAQAARVPRAA